MSNITYKYAYDEQNTIVCIDDVTREDRSQHTYHCISCGEEMIARLGEKRRPHFSHKAETDHCNSETYLHKLGKYIIREKFYNSPEFKIFYRQIHACSSKSTCPFHTDDCAEESYEPFDLKEYYDTCEEEKEIEGFVADILLSNSKFPNRERVLIEILVSHKCSQEKKDSKLRIIEIPIKSEEDILFLRDNPITEIKEHEPWERVKHQLGEATFMNFNRDSKKSIQLSKKYLNRFYIFRSGSAWVDLYEEQSECSKYNVRMHPEAMLELTMSENVYSSYYAGIVWAMKNGVIERNCNMCKYLKIRYDSIDGRGSDFCCMSKNYGTPSKPNQAYANDCRYYILDKYKYTEGVVSLTSCVVSKVE